MSFSKPIVEPSPTMYQSDPRQMGSGCKKYNPQRSFKESDTTAVPPPLSFQELDEEISKYKCSSHNKACSVGRGGCFGSIPLRRCVQRRWLLYCRYTGRRLGN